MHRILPVWGILIAALCPLHGQEETLSTRYLRLQEAYTQRLQTIEQDYRKTERELLNEFILALPRIEKRFREEGDLEGVVAARKLQEEVLATMRFPNADEELPGELQPRVQTLLEEQESARVDYQKKLDALNRILHDALEPYKKAFTIAGEFETAMEIRAIQMRLAGELDLEETDETDKDVEVSNDPNAIPFSLEPEGYARIPGLTPRKSAIAFEPKINGDVEIRENEFRFREGKLTIPGEAMTLLLQGVRKNQMLSIEFGLRPWRNRQGNARLPAVLLMYGNSLTDANMAVTQEGEHLYLHLRTSMEPEGNRPYHRIRLGKADAGRAQQFAVTFRTGVLAIFKDGDEINTLRGEPRGLLSNWEEYPVVMGEIPGAPENPKLPDVIHWRGQIFHFYMRSTLDNPREVKSNFERFKTAVTH